MARDEDEERRELEAALAELPPAPPDPIEAAQAEAEGRELRESLEAYFGQASTHPDALRARAPVLFVFPETLFVPRPPEPLELGQLYLGRFGSALAETFARMNALAQAAERAYKALGPELGFLFLELRAGMHRRRRLRLARGRARPSKGMRRHLRRRRAQERRQRVEGLKPSTWTAVGAGGARGGRR